MASSPPHDSLPSLPVEFPADHPISRRQAQLNAARAAAAGEDGDAKDLSASVSGAPSKDSNEAFQAHLLARHSLSLSTPDSPAEVARRMSIVSSSRRGSILAFPPVEEKPVVLDHLPQPGHDDQVDEGEIQKEIEEIDTVG